jgi:hypothetical protein
VSGEGLGGAFEADTWLAKPAAIAVKVVRNFFIGYSLSALVCRKFLFSENILPAWERGKQGKTLSGCTFSHNRISDSNIQKIYSI